jgi:hypothetical protein
MNGGLIRIWRQIGTSDTKLQFRPRLAEALADNLFQCRENIRIQPNRR